MSITAFGQTQINPKDYRFMVLQMPKLDMQFPENREIPADNKTFYALSYDDTNNTAFIYNDYVCGYYEVPAPMRAGFKTSARNLQAENPDEYWKLVKEVMDKVTANWKAKKLQRLQIILLRQKLQRFLLMILTSYMKQRM